MLRRRQQGGEPGGRRSQGPGDPEQVHDEVGDADGDQQTGNEADDRPQRHQRGLPLEGTLRIVRDIAVCLITPAQPRRNTANVFFFRGPQPA